MAYLTQEQIASINSNLTSDPGFLGKLYKAKKARFLTDSVEHSLVEDLLSEGWEIVKRLKTKTNIRKPKLFSRQFEDDIWCQFYDLGYRHLNINENLKLPWGEQSKQDKQIDVVVIDDETVFLIECKSKEDGRSRNANFKDQFDALSLRLDGFRKSIYELLGKEVKVKYILATRNIALYEGSDDHKRLMSTQSFHYDESTFNYVESLIKNYNTPKIKAAKYQFLGLIFRETTIGEKIQIPAIMGKMGGKKYYSFSIEPEVLLKIGYVLHRTKSNTADFPTYQRLLKANRLPDIRKFIEEEDGYFPNSVIINFGNEDTSNKLKLEFQPASKEGMKTSARHGLLKIPNAYAIAYIIDGQHRLYGYAGSDHAKKDQIPVVAFERMEVREKIELFMKINEKQKAVPKSLIIALEKDMLWEAKLASDRLKALRSSITSELSDGSGPLSGIVSIGEEQVTQGNNKISGDFIARSFNPSLFTSGLLPQARGNKYIPETTATSLYDINNNDNNSAMKNCQKLVVELINEVYKFIEESYPKQFHKKEYFFVSSRGIYALIVLLGELNSFLLHSKKITRFSSTSQRMAALEKYLIMLFEGVIESKEQKTTPLLKLQGAGAHIPWIMYFIEMVNLGFPSFKPHQFEVWQEQQDGSLQTKAKGYADAIESFLIKTVLGQLKNIYKDRWEIEVVTIKAKCTERALKQQAENSKIGLGDELEDWTEQLNLSDFRTMIMDHWTDKPEEPDENFKNFADLFSYDVGMGFHSKGDKVKWLQTLNGLRRNIGHSGVKAKGVSRENVDFIENIYFHFELQK